MIAHHSLQSYSAPSLSGAKHVHLITHNKNVMTSVLGLKLNMCIEADSIIMFCHLGHVDDTVREGWVGEEERDHGGGRRKCPTR